MKRMIICAAAAIGFLAFSAPLPAQARMAYSGLNQASPELVQDVQYRRHRRYNRHRSYNRHYNRNRYRHCWNERVRVRTHAGHFVVRTHRRCGWRWR